MALIAQPTIFFVHKSFMAAKYKKPSAANRLRVRSNYNLYGYLSSVQDVQSGTVYWSAEAVGGGKFGNGATTAAFAFLYNDYVHSAQQARDRYNDPKKRGHHWVPFGSTDKLDISPEARSYWGQSTSGEALPSNIHNPGHNTYNAAVKDELLSWSESRNIDLSKMTVNQAKEFEAHVRTSARPEIATVLNRIEQFHRLSPGTKTLVRGLALVGLGRAADAYYPSPQRAVQCQADSRIDGC